MRDDRTISRTLADGFAVQLWPETREPRRYSLRWHIAPAGESQEGHYCMCEMFGDEESGAEQVIAAYEAGRKAAWQGAIKDIRVERYGRSGWSWIVEWNSGETRAYRTSGDGDGLFVLQPNGYEWHQTHGTTQYRLSASSEAAARAELMRRQGR